jgi:hypothetical protein
VIARESPGGPSCSRAPSSAPAPRQRMNGARLCAKSKDREKRNAPARYRSFGTHRTDRDSAIPASTNQKRAMARMSCRA